METSDSILNSILADGPSPGTLFLVLSKMKEEGQLRRVIQECHRALDVYPHDINIRRLLAESYFESGQISRAESELERVIKQIDDLMPSYMLQADIYSHQKRGEEAAKALKVYLAHRPDDEEAIRLLETLQPPEEPPTELAPATEEEAVPFEEIEEEVVPPLEEEGLPDIATPTLAELYFDQGRLKEAIETYEKIITQDPDDTQSRQRLDELMALLAQEEPVEVKREDRARQKKEKMIVILEAWLANIREQSKTEIPVS